jgi:hypothetical protein
MLARRRLRGAGGYKMSALSFNKLSLNFFLIPEKTLTERQEKWEDTIDFTSKYSEVNLGRATHLYYEKNLQQKIETVSKHIADDKRILNVSIIHETSYSGMPYQLSCNYQSENGLINILFDGLLFYMTVDKENTPNTLALLINETKSELGYRNECISIVKRFGFNVYSMYDPFWDFTISSISELHLSTDADYPAFRIVCNDIHYYTLTNYGDKQVDTVGKKYLVYFAEHKDYIRVRIAHDMIIGHDLDQYNNYLQGLNRIAIEANSAFINSLKNIPGNVLTFLKRNSKWKKIQKYPNEILNIESSLPKILIFNDVLSKKIERRSSYYNIPPTMWPVGAEPDEKLLYQREIPNFFELVYKDEKVSIDNDKPILPLYNGVDSLLKSEYEKLANNIASAVRNLNNATTIYSTNFGFDALWIAILALLISIFPFSELCTIFRVVFQKLNELVK